MFLTSLVMPSGVQQPQATQTHHPRSSPAVTQPPHYKTVECSLSKVLLFDTLADMDSAKPSSF